MSVQELKTLLSEWEDEEGDYGDVWSFLYDEETPIQFDDGRTVTVVETYRSWPNADPMINVVVEFDGKFYHNDSYYDSWGGETDWDPDEVTEVKRVEVTKTEWQEVK